MQLWVGLGNPGQPYTGNRHNIGFMAVDRVATAHGFGPWQRKFRGLVAEGRIAGEKIILLKPQTFMNLSGESVAEAARFWKIPPENIIVFHDELDLAPFKVRVKRGGGHAGHNGLRSIIQQVGETFCRVRIGIGHPGAKERVAAYVLEDFPKSEAERCALLLDALAKAAPLLARGELDRFQSHVAAALVPLQERRENPSRVEGGRGLSQEKAPWEKEHGSDESLPQPSGQAMHRKPFAS